MNNIEYINCYNIYVYVISYVRCAIELYHIYIYICIIQSVYDFNKE